MKVADISQQLYTSTADRWNIASEGKTFRCKMIEPGIVSYRDVPGGGIELLRKETIDRAILTAIGNPLTIGHVMVTAENRLNVENGIIDSVEYDAGDGWFYCNGAVDTDQARTRINAGWKPSCAYRVKSFGPGGVYHGIKYDQEITEIEFNHLAIVEKPRYEGATFRLNSLTASKSTMNVFKFLKKLVTRENGADGKPVETTKVETSEVNGEAEIEIDGEKVRLNDLAATWRTQKGQVFAGDDCVEIDGNEVKMNELVESYRKNKAGEAARKNAAATETPEQKKVREDKEKADAETTRLNAAAAEKAKEKGTESFYRLHSARENPTGKPEGEILPTRSKTSGSLTDRLAAGQARYGSGKN